MSWKHCLGNMKSAHKCTTLLQVEYTVYETEKGELPELKSGASEFDGYIITGTHKTSELTLFQAMWIWLMLGGFHTAALKATFIPFPQYCTNICDTA